MSPAIYIHINNYSTIRTLQGCREIEILDGEFECDPWMRHGRVFEYLRLSWYWYCAEVILGILVKYINPNPDNYFKIHVFPPPKKKNIGSISY